LHKNPSVIGLPLLLVINMKLKVKSSLCVVMNCIMRTYGVTDLYLHAFLTSALEGDDWSVLLCGRFIPVERTLDTDWIGGWKDLRADLHAMRIE
jgi:hypothetical protein